MQQLSLARLGDIEVVDYRCTALRGARPVEEQHGRACIALVRSGAFEARTGRAPAPLGPGALFLGNRGQPYTCTHDHAGGDRCLALLLGPTVLDEAARASGLPRDAGWFSTPSLPPDARLAAQLLSLLSSIERPDAGASAEERALTIVSETLALHARTPVTAPPSRPVDRRRAVEAMLFLEEHADQPLSLSQLSSQAGLSSFHFLRLFRQQLGLTPHQFLVRARLRRAAALLVDGDAPITEVAFAVGFGDLAHFIRSFKQSIGCSPSVFRAAARGDGRKIRQAARALAR